MRLRREFGLFLGLISLCGGSAFARYHPGHPDQLSIGVGAFNMVRPQRSGQFQLEYRWDPNCYRIRPLLGGFVTDKTTFYIYGGVAYDIYLGRYIVVTPAFAPGIYFKGRGKDLGFPLEFRSSIEIAFETAAKSRVGAQFYHISNASLGRRNPGEESLIFFYSIPLYR